MHGSNYELYQYVRVYECVKSHPTISQVRRTLLLAWASLSVVLLVANSVFLFHARRRCADQAAYVLTNAGSVLRLLG